MPKRHLAALLFGAAAPLYPAAPALADEIDLDPLRRYLPPGDIYMQVPGALLAVEDTAAWWSAIACARAAAG